MIHLYIYRICKVIVVKLGQAYIVIDSHHFFDDAEYAKAGQWGIIPRREGGNCRTFLAA
jgi:hypothetical protein